MGMMTWLYSDAIDTATKQAPSIPGRKTGAVCLTRAHSSVSRGRERKRHSPR